MVPGLDNELMFVAIADVVAVYVELDGVVGLEGEMELGVCGPRYLKSVFVVTAQGEPLTTAVAGHERREQNLQVNDVR